MRRRHQSLPPIQPRHQPPNVTVRVSCAPYVTCSMSGWHSARAISMQRSWQNLIAQPIQLRPLHLVIGRDVTLFAILCAHGHLCTLTAVGLYGLAANQLCILQFLDIYSLVSVRGMRGCSGFLRSVGVQVSCNNIFLHQRLGWQHQRRAYCPFLY